MAAGICLLSKSYLTWNTSAMFSEHVAALGGLGVPAYICLLLLPCTVLLNQAGHAQANAVKYPKALHLLCALKNNV